MRLIEDNIEVMIFQRRSWRSLDESARTQLRAFLAPSGAATLMACRAPYRAENRLPDRFATDIVTGGPGIRAAFPALTRTVERITASNDVVTVRVACEALHSGPFFDLLRATGKRVRFSEIHELVPQGGALLEDRVTLDLRTILRQLAVSRRHE